MGSQLECYEGATLALGRDQVGHKRNALPITR